MVLAKSLPIIAISISLYFLKQTMILLSSSIGILIEIRTNQTELELESVQLKQNPNRNLDKSIGIPWEPGQSMCQHYHGMISTRYERA